MTRKKILQLPQAVTRGATKPAVPKNAQVLVLEITLKDIKPRIWRRFAVTDDQTLGALHLAIQAVMGWTDTHLHVFEIKGKQYSAPDPLYSPVEDMDEEVLDAWKVGLKDVLGGKGFKFRHLYDFGDGWEHQLKVVAVQAPDPSVRYPVCLAGERACPPEDCGGPWGYTEKLEIMNNPKHEEYAELMEWMPEGFDAEAFDLDAVNESLRG